MIASIDLRCLEPIDLVDPSDMAGIQIKVWVSGGKLETFGQQQSVSSNRPIRARHGAVGICQGNVCELSISRAARCLASRRHVPIPRGLILATYSLCFECAFKPSIVYFGAFSELLLNPGRAPCSDRLRSDYSWPSVEPSRVTQSPSRHEQHASPLQGVRSTLESTYESP